MDLLLTVMAGVALVALPVWVLYERWRERSIRAQAEVLGFSFIKKATHIELGEPTSGAWLGSWVRVAISALKYVICGSWDGMKVAVFECSFSPRQNAVYTQTVVCVYFNQASLPRFVIHRKDLGSGFGPWIKGHKSIKLDAPVGFSRQHILSVEDEMAVRALLTQEFLEFFVGKETLHVECLGDRLLLYWVGKQLPPSKISFWIDRAVWLSRQLITNAPIAD